MNIIEEGNRGMRIAAILMTGAFLVFAGTGTGFTQERAKSEKSAAAAKVKNSEKGGTKEKAQSKTAEYRMGGIVTKIDSEGKITIKQSKLKGERVANLKMDKSLSKEISKIKRGDVVDVWVEGKNIRSFRKVE